MLAYRQGRHEHGQNFLHDQNFQRAIVERIEATTGLITEIGPGDGALTHRLAALGRPLTAAKVDPRLARCIERRVGSRVEVVCGDFLRHRLPNAPHVLVGNLPFHLTTAVLRHILRAPGWTHAVLLVPVGGGRVVAPASAGRP